MIGKLTGTVDAIGDGWLILDVGGVGYEVHAPSRTIARLKPGEGASFIIEMLVREDMIRLYGFATAGERTWFRQLQSVQGVGAKLAVAILGALSPSDIAQAVMMQDQKLISRAPGVGPKVAARLIAELRDKVAKLSTTSPLDHGTAAKPGAAPAGISGAADAISALTNLGYGPAEAMAAINGVLAEKGTGLKTEELIRLGLKALAK